MKFIPILFSTPMVQAILEGRKTVTRRVITKQNSTTTNDDWSKFDFTDAVVEGEGWEMEYLTVARPDDGTRHRIFPKIYPADVWTDEREIGTCLWGRETFRTINHSGHGSPYWYKADACDTDLEDKSIKWKPSLFMPKDACRLFLQVESVKVERLQDMDGNIAEECDSLREGIMKFHHGDGNYGYHWKGDMDGENFVHPYEAFADLWKHINGEESWKENPFVWRIEFKKIEQPEGFLISPQNLAKRQRS